MAELTTCPGVPHAGHASADWTCPIEDGYSRGPGEPWLAHNMMYEAERQIRARYRVSSPHWRFWSNLADYLNVWAMRGKQGLLKTMIETREFNRAQAMAGTWLDTAGEALGTDEFLEAAAQAVDAEAEATIARYEQLGREIHAHTGRGNQELADKIQECTRLFGLVKVLRNKSRAIRNITED
jgi:hypothetical protein